jgi:hypothetical protein
MNDKTGFIYIQIVCEMYLVCVNMSKGSCSSHLTAFVSNYGGF